MNNSKRYKGLVSDRYEKYKNITLPPEYAYFTEDNLFIRLACYKFVAHMLRPEDRVLEIGCGSGLGAIFLSQHCKSVKGVDVNEREILEAQSINRRKNITFEVKNLFKFPRGQEYDCIVALDVIEHMSKDSGDKPYKIHG